MHQISVSFTLCFFCLIINKDFMQSLEKDCMLLCCIICQNGLILFTLRSLVFSIHADKNSQLNINNEIVLMSEILRLFVM